jgi:hypothetical protein
MSTFAIAGARPRRSMRGAVSQTAAGLIVAGVVAALTAFVTRRAAAEAAAVLLVVAGGLWFAATRRTQLALALFMLYLGLLDGYLKLASGSNLVTFVRDLLLYAIVVGLLVRAIVQGKRLPLPPLSAWVVAFCVLVLVQIANPQDGTIVHSLAGVRQHLEFVPLFFLTFAFVRSVKALRMVVILLAVIAAANGVASFVQFKESPAQFAAWGPGYAQRVLGTGGAFSGGGRTFKNGEVGGGTRPFGLGSDGGDGGWFGAFAFCGILALAAFSRRRRYQLFAVVAALGAALAVITSQDRGVIVGSVIIVLSFALLIATSRNRFTSVAGLALAGIAAVIVIQAVIGSVGTSQVRYQGLSPSSILQTTNKARGKSIALIPHNLVTYPFGAGLGTGGPAISAPGASQLTLTKGPDVETEFSFLIVETGIAGMIALTGFTLSMLVIGFRRCRLEPDPEARALLAALIAPVAGIFVVFFTSAPSPSVPPGPYLWAVGGIVAYWLVVRPKRQRHGI